MNYAKIYQRQILNDFTRANFVASFNSKKVLLDLDKIEVKNWDGSTYFTTKLIFTEVDPFSETLTYIGEYSDKTSFRLLKPGKLYLVQFKDEYGCEDAFTIASLDPQGYAIHFILTKNIDQTIQIQEKDVSDQVFKLVDGIIMAHNFGLQEKVIELTIKLNDLDPNMEIGSTHPKIKELIYTLQKYR